MLRSLSCLCVGLSLVLTGCEWGSNQALRGRQLDPIKVGNEAGHDHGDGHDHDHDHSDSTAEWVTTNSGLKYRILKEGKGKKPASSNEVTVHYRGWLDNGKEFDSSYGRGEPISFPLTGVIPGWTEGMTYVSEGGEIELEIPANLGYGSQQAGQIPPNSTLHFTVELLKIK
ncbi:FKBP-type peptidyl-prolyl cis-trans isomerase [Polystyrenella longa]|nr:FKBP-type peptidyl-prolyl cis-trans isomerase [Polystyrenella longa]